MPARYTLAEPNPIVELNMRFEFRAEHALRLPDGTEEDRHFHDYLLIVTIERVLDANGFVLENRALDRIVMLHAIAELRGAWLHNIIEQPTMERLAVWVWERLQKPLEGLLSSVSVSEQKEHGATATYRGPRNT
ncbi:6-carboxytetrahydropterin synthase [Candidatus Uhrbacteria bacterium]|nr:6-carboxytetrahydropterin synthase [Candidatus Uhrbacteria bacterium]